ncbi:MULTISPECIES: c-type cytochrome [Corallincola]|uniref:Cytochrome c n=3 Tax=Corallincola TaxID=1775176 RepID=A0A368N4U7_9GAMM|nr:MULTISPECIES: cytochrome c [Corallincola]RCU45528.1 cytochrome c [Corallincola holothuriorum]TAA40957.1 cytochrome c [Corallincola spongiicola]TCI02588.1 cytochrome c [Corallincola luteus]
MSPRSTLLALSVISSLICSTAVNADDIAIGKQKATTCAACHGEQGVSVIPMYPHLAGQQAVYFENQMKAFRSGARPNPIMGNLAKPLSDEDIRQLALYYASLKL